MKVLLDEFLILMIVLVFMIGLITFS